MKGNFKPLRGSEKTAAKISHNCTEEEKVKEGRKRQQTRATLVDPEDAVVNVSQSGANGRFAAVETFLIDRRGEMINSNAQSYVFCRFVNAPKTQPCRTPGRPPRP